MKAVLITIAIVAVAAAGFFGVRAYRTGKARAADQERTESLAGELEKSKAREEELSRQAQQETEAREMAERQAQQKAEAEARRLAQSQVDREAQEAARKRAEDQASKAMQDMEKIRGERAQLEAETKRLQELRAKESAAAEQKLAQAKSALEKSLQEKNAEIDRQAALIAEYRRIHNPPWQKANPKQPRLRNECPELFFRPPTTSARATITCCCKRSPKRTNHRLPFRNQRAVRCDII